MGGMLICSEWLLRMSQVGRLVARCNAVANGDSPISAADMTAITSAAVALMASEDVCVAYSKAVSRVSFESASVASVISTLVAMMKAHLTSSSVQESACRAVLVVGYKHVQCLGLEVSEGGLEAAYAAMVNFRDSVAVQVAACELLACLASKGGAVDVIVSSGALERVYAAMDRYRSSEELQVTACVVLGNLAVKLDSASQIVSSGELARVYAAIDGHLVSARVQEAALFCLGKLAANVTTSSEIFSAAVLERVFAAMDSHVLCEAVQRAACGALFHLAAHDENNVRIVQLGGLERVYAAMAGHVASAVVQEMACKALGNLAVHEDHAVKILLSRGLERVYAAMDGCTSGGVPYSWEPGTEYRRCDENRVFRWIEEGVHGDGAPQSIGGCAAIGVLCSAVPGWE